MHYFLTTILLVLLPLSASAKWYEASSDHFIVYANDSESDINRFSQQLEQYHSALVRMTSVDFSKPSPSNRVTVFVVSNKRQVQKLYGEGGRNIAGFYIPRAGGSIAIVPRIRENNRGTTFSMTVLLHEYAHHFMISRTDFPSPSWLSEGGAEFFSSAEFTKNGGLSIGRPATHRANELQYAKNVTAEELLDPKTFQEKKENGWDSFYGKSWLLYHYLTFSEDRSGQMTQYVNQLMAGKNSLQAGQDVFGSLSELENNLRTYLRQRRMQAVSFNAENLEVGDTKVRQLREGEAKIMDVRIRSRVGVNQKLAQQVIIDARNIASKYPDDPAVMSALAEAEFDAGNDAAAILAADSALAKDPGQLRAYVQKGYALYRQASEADDPEQAYIEAFTPFAALNKMENDHPLPLIYYYENFIAQSKKPTELAIQGLERALYLAPFDTNLRLRVVFQQLEDQQYERVRQTLSPIAFNPHSSELTLAAQKVLTLLEEGEEIGSDEFKSLLTVSVEE